MSFGIFRDEGICGPQQCVRGVHSEKDSCICIKEAVNGTTLIDNGEDSYIERMRDNLDPKRQVDLFICQLSTNDATRNSPLGEISESRDLDSFDVKTVCGAIEYIIAYAKETWHCPVMFYTNPQYDSDTYAKMVEALLKIQEKWQIGVIDFWNDEQINRVFAGKTKTVSSGSDSSDEGRLR